MAKPKSALDLQCILGEIAGILWNDDGHPSGWDSITIEDIADVLSKNGMAPHNATSGNPTADHVIPPDDEIGENSRGLDCA